MEKRRMPEEWYRTIKQANLKRADVSRMIGVEPKRLSNIYSRLVYIDDDIYGKLKKIVDEVEEVTIAENGHVKNKDTFVDRIVNIVCIECKNFFEPWGNRNGIPVCVCRKCNSKVDINSGNI